MTPAMTSRGLVKAAIQLRVPDRLPVNQPELGVSDLWGANPKAAASFRPAADGQDEWGCLWAHTDMENMGQPKGHPLETIPDDLSRTAFPDYDDESRWTEMGARAEQGRAAGKYVMAAIFMVLFERMHSLHGFENTLCDLLTDRPAMERLADHIVKVHLDYVRNVSSRFGDRIDAITMTDDWGTQQAAFISFDLWADFFLPRYKRLFDTMHAAGYDVWVHSCGRINEVIEGYIRAGVDVVNVQQPRALGIPEIGNRYGGRITFETLADIQATLPGGDRRRIDADVEELMTHWARPDGGLVFSDYGDNAAIGVRDPETKRYMYAQFSRWSEKLYGRALPEPA